MDDLIDGERTNAETAIQKEEQDEKDAKNRWINFTVAIAVTWVVIVLTDRGIYRGTDLGHSFGRYLMGSFALQILPLFFGWLARKFRFTSEKWVSLYWVTLAIVLTFRAILLYRATA